MFLSIRPFFKKKSNFNNISSDRKSIIISILLNYVLLSGFYLLIASIFFPLSSDYFLGYVLLAIIPPAIAIVPLCYLAKCDIKVADSALILSYFLALIIIPTTLYALFGTNIKFMLLARSLLILILIPIILAYLTRNIETKVINYLFNYTKIITNLLLGLIIFIVVSLNRSILLNISDINIRHIFLINITVIFTLGLIVYYVSRQFVSEMDAIDYSLYSTQKNEMTGLAIVLLLFTAHTAIPLIVALVVQFTYFIVFERIILANKIEDLRASEK